MMAYDWLKMIIDLSFFDRWSKTNGDHFDFLSLVMDDWAPELREDITVICFSIIHQDNSCCVKI